MRLLRRSAPRNDVGCHCERSEAISCNIAIQNWYNSCARSAYYACFHAAITALLQAGLTPPEPARGWGHDWVYASFVGQLIQRRKIYPANLRRTLPDLLALRHKADYRTTHVSQREAQQAVRSAQALVQAVTAYVQGREGSA
jgi:uncharacterized protein (UPF0332 family)